MEKNNIINLRVLSTLSILLYHLFCPYIKWYWNGDFVNYFFPNLVKWGSYFFERVLADKMLPTFFLISGILFYSNLPRYINNGIKSIIWKKFDRLIIPYALVSLLCLNLDLPPIGIANSDGHLWFLLILFSYFFVSILLYKVNSIWHIFIGLIMYVSYIILSKFNFRITYLFNFFLEYYIFFSCGYLVSKYQSRLNQVKGISILFFCSWIFVLVLEIRSLIPIFLMVLLYLFVII